MVVYFALLIDLCGFQKGYMERFGFRKLPSSYRNPEPSFIFLIFELFSWLTMCDQNFDFCILEPRYSLWSNLDFYNCPMCTCREGNGTPLQYSCLENPMDGGAWRAAVHGVAESWTRLSDFTFIFHFHALENELATHSSALAWRIPGTGEPGGLLSMGSHRVAHNWSDLAAAAAPFLWELGLWDVICKMFQQPCFPSFWAAKNRELISRVKSKHLYL